MKRFSDIKVRENRKRTQKTEAAEDGFWHGFSDQPEESPLLNPKLKSAILRGTVTVAILLSFFFFSLARAYDTKGRIEVLTDNAKIYLDNAFSALEVSDYDKAMIEAEKARTNLAEIKLNLQSWGQDIKYLSWISNRHSTVVNLEMALNASSMILNVVSDSRSELNQVLSREFANDTVDGKNFALDISAASKAFFKTIESSNKKLNESAKILAGINVKSLGDFGQSIGKAKVAVEAARNSLEGTKKLTETDLPWISGAGGEKRNYLVIFQNNSELRGGSGGSFGSFGIAHFDSGKFTGVDFGTNIYKIDHAFEAANTVVPPEDLGWVVGDGRWTLKDSGWAVDGPEAFDKIKWFYEIETGEKIDGVLTVDTSAFVDILRLIGPVELKKYGKTIDANNFKEETERQVHETYFTEPGALAENEPKEFLAEMMPIVLDRLLARLSDEKSLVSLLSTFSDAFAQKHLLFYVYNKDIKADLEKYNIAGKVLNIGNDYLYVNNSNLAGGKSSLNINEDISLESTISADGKVKNSLTISRTHNGSGVWPDGTNLNLVRLLLPKTATVTNFSPVAGNFEQGGKAGFKNGQPYWMGEEASNPTAKFWMNTAPKETSQAKVDYSFSIDGFDGGEYTYKMVFQRQPGANADKVKYILHFPEGFRPVNLAAYDPQTSSAKFEFELSKDKIFEIKIRKNSIF